MTEPALGGESQVPTPDPIATDYLLLALRLDQRLPGFVDGYFGPARLKAQVDLESLRAAAALAADARQLAGRVEADIADPLRRAWLIGQLVAIEANARALDEAPGGFTGQRGGRPPAPGRGRPPAAAARARCPRRARRPPW